MAANTNVYCHNVPLHWEKTDIEQAFIKYGSIVSSRILMDQTRNVSRGVAFVRFATTDEATAAIAAMNNVVPVGGTTPLLCKYAKESNSAASPYGAAPSPYGAAATRYSPYGRPAGGSGEDKTNLYVQNLPLAYDEESMKAIFSAYGTINSCYVLKDRETGVSRGIGFARYASAPEAEAAKTALQGTVLEGAEMGLHITFARDSKSKREVAPPAAAYSPYAAAYSPYAAYAASPYGAPPAAASPYGAAAYGAPPPPAAYGAAAAAAYGAPPAAVAPPAAYGAPPAAYDPYSVAPPAAYGAPPAAAAATAAPAAYGAPPAAAAPYYPPAPQAAQR